MFASDGGKPASDPLHGTCAVCGSLCDPLLLPNPLGKQSHTCKNCHKKVCGKCYAKSKEICVICATGKGSWCSTPKGLE